MPQAAMIVAAVSAVGGAVMQKEQADAIDRAQRKQARIERRITAIENARRARQAIAAQRIQQAEIQAGAANIGLESSSAVRGAVGSLTTQTAANIGAARTQAAAAHASNQAAIRGSKQAAQYGFYAGLFDATSNIAGAMYNPTTPTAATPPAGRPAPTINPTVTIRPRQ